MIPKIAIRIGHRLLSTRLLMSAPNMQTRDQRQKPAVFVSALFAANQKPLLRVLQFDLRQSVTHDATTPSRFRHFVIDGSVAMTPCDFESRLLLSMTLSQSKTPQKTCFCQNVVSRDPAFTAVTRPTT